MRAALTYWYNYSVSVIHTCNFAYDLILFILEYKSIIFLGYVMCFVQFSCLPSTSSWFVVVEVVCP